MDTKNTGHLNLDIVEEPRVVLWASCLSHVWNGNDSLIQNLLGYEWTDYEHTNRNHDNEDCSTAHRTTDAKLASRRHLLPRHGEEFA